MRKYKIWLLNKIVKNLFNGVTENEVLRYKNNQLYIGSKIVTEVDRLSIKNGAESIKSLLVWEVLVRDIKYNANKLMYERSSTIDDIIFGKAMLYNLDLIEKKLDNLSKIK